MLDILERFVKGRDYKYMRMDGGTSIASRQPMISKFNSVSEASRGGEVSCVVCS